MHLTGMKLGGVPPFTDPIVLRFDERVNVFIGPNASGKSTVLQALAEHFIGPEANSKRRLSPVTSTLSEFPDDEFDEMVSEELENGRLANVLSASEDWFGTKHKYHRPELTPAVIHIGSVREGLPGVSNQASSNAYGETSAEVLAGPFSGSRTMCASDLLRVELWEAESEETILSSARGGLIKAVELSEDCSKRICDEVIRDPRSHNYIPGFDVRDYLDYAYINLNNIAILRQMGIDTTDIRNFDYLPYDEQPSYSAYREPPESAPIYLGHLSSGTEGTLLWIRWLALKIAHHYDFEEVRRDYDGIRFSNVGGWENKPAILLIDEIENHLHPTWQRRVIPALLEHFPGLQIFATTHSPFVVAGLKAGQVHILERDANGVVTASTEQRDVIGWTADEILRGMMGVDDPTDDATANAAKELRELRTEEPKIDEKEEEARQQRIRELRAMVNRDLLAGGPMAAQRELFEQNLAEILEEHRRAQGLSQD